MPRSPVHSLLIASLCATGLGLRAEISPPPLGPDYVSPTVKATIERGLEFLANHQNPDGSYGQYRWENSPTYPTAISSLVGMAFLASGSTPTRGPHAERIRKITDYLLTRCANSNGFITDYRAGEDRAMYSHSFSMTFLAQIYGQEHNEATRRKIREVLRKAIDFSIGSQTDEGGWGYHGDYTEHEGTLTVTQLQALRSCRDAGFVVPKQTIDRAVHYIDISLNRTGSEAGSVRYRPSSDRIREGVTCAALVTLWSAGRYDDPMFKLIASYIRREIYPQFRRSSVRSRRNRHAEYVMYYLAQARYLLGGSDWPSFYKRYAAMFVQIQERDGHWEGADDGEIYGTAIALLALQLPYNRLPIFQR